MAPDQNHTPPNCLETGICIHHGETVERRKSDAKDIKYLKDVVEKLFIRWENEIPDLKIKVFSIYVSLTLLLFMVGGAYSFTAISVSNHRADMSEFKSEMKAQLAAVKASSDRGEEILLAKINRTEKDNKTEREGIMAQVVTLLTSDAEQKEWQRGVLRQLEVLNTNFTKALLDQHNQVTDPTKYFKQGGRPE